MWIEEESPLPSSTVHVGLSMEDEVFPVSENQIYPVLQEPFSLTETLRNSYCRSIFSVDCINHIRRG